MPTYLRHFQVGLGAVPAWAPPGEDHLLRSSSVVVDVTYAPPEIRYRTFAQYGDDVLRLAGRSRPPTVFIDGVIISRPPESRRFGVVYDAATGILRIHRDGAP